MKGNFQARFWNSGGRGDSPTDCRKLSDPLCSNAPPADVYHADSLREVSEHYPQGTGTRPIRGRPTFPMLVEAVACLFKGEKPDLRWITQRKSLPVPSTPVIRYPTGSAVPVCTNKGVDILLRVGSS